MSDQIINLLAYDGKISVICANSTSLVEEARKIHDLSPVVTAAFGRMLTMTAIMGAEMKDNKNKITVQIKGNGPIEMMVATANNTPTVKGYVINPQVDIPVNEFGKLDVSRAIGEHGYLNVIKNVGLKEPYTGISPLVSGEIAEDFANYFVTSEQRNSAVALGVLVNKEGVKVAGGYLINPMPDATEKEIAKVEQAIFKAGAMSKMLEQQLSLLEIAKKITGDEEIKIIKNNTKVKYYCDCSKKHMSEGLATLGKQELIDIIQTDKHADLECHFCNKKYHFSKEEIENIVKSLS